MEILLGAKVVAVNEGRQVSPTPKQLKQINELARVPYAADEVYVGYMDLANDMVDRTFEWFPVGILRQFAKTATGKSMLIGHDRQREPLGLFFDGSVEKIGDVNWLRTWYYMPITDQNEHARQMIDSGVWRYASIGFGRADGGKLELVCDICGRTIDDLACPHYPGDEVIVGEQSVRATFHYAGQAQMVEGSIVYMGAQYGAEVKSARLLNDDSLNETMEVMAAQLAAYNAVMFTKSVEGVLIPRTKNVLKTTGGELFADASQYFARLSTNTRTLESATSADFMEQGNGDEGEIYSEESQAEELDAEADDAGDNTAAETTDEGIPADEGQGTGESASNDVELKGISDYAEYVVSQYKRRIEAMIAELPTVRNESQL